MADSVIPSDLTYHSTLEKHVRSISQHDLSQLKSRRDAELRGQREEPMRPSILSKSNYRRSHQKSIKKGISRVSKSKLPSNKNSPEREKDDQKSVKKLDFNTAEVVAESSDKRSIVKEQFGHDRQEQQESMDRSIDEYRIVTYVAPYSTVKEKDLQHGMADQSKRAPLQKENSLNHSNAGGFESRKSESNSHAFNGNSHSKKQNCDFDSEGGDRQSRAHFRQGSIEVISPPNAAEVLQLTTWRNSNEDIYIAEDHRVQADEKVSEGFDSTRKMGESSKEAQTKIRHLEQEIIRIEREKGQLERRCAQFEAQTHDLKSKVAIESENLDQRISVESRQSMEQMVARLEKQISEKSLTITELKGQCKQLEQYLRSEQQCNAKKDQKIKELQEKLNSKCAECETQERKISGLQSEIKSKTQLRNYSGDSKYESNINSKDLEKQLQICKGAIEKWERDYKHLQSKHRFIQDELQHIKYVQGNIPSKAPTNSYSSNHKRDFSYIEREEKILDLQSKLKVSVENEALIQKSYEGLKVNFKALEELYMRSEDQTHRLREMTHRSQQKGDDQAHILETLKEVSQRAETDSMQLKKSDEQCQILRKQIKALEREQQNFWVKYNALQQSYEELNQRYLKEIQNSSKALNNHIEADGLWKESLEKEHRVKIEAMCEQYEAIVDSLNREISHLTDDLLRSKQKEKQALIERIETAKGSEQGNSYTLQRSSRKLRHSRRGYESVLQGSRRNTLSVENWDIATLKEQVYSLQQKVRNLNVQKQTLEDKLEDKERRLSHLESEVKYYLQQKEAQIRQKLELVEALEAEQQRSKSLQSECEGMRLQLEHISQNYEESNVLATKGEQQLRQNRILIVEQQQRIVKREEELEKVNMQIYQMKAEVGQLVQRLDQYEEQNRVIQEQSTNHRSKEEYYKMVAAQKEAEIEEILRKNKQEQLSRSRREEADYKQKRKNELYRLEVYRDLNILLGIKDCSIVESFNEENYLNLLFSTVKSQVLNKGESVSEGDELIQLKKLIVEMEARFAEEKVYIKKDYDVLYEKYLKYKTMSQSMQKDIEKYKVRLISEADFVV